MTRLAEELTRLHLRTGSNATLATATTALMGTAFLGYSLGSEADVVSISSPATLAEAFCRIVWPELDGVCCRRRHRARRRWRFYDRLECISRA
jgi:hypothetical protein